MNTFFIFTASVFFVTNLFAAEPDWTAYDSLLKAHVKHGQRDGVSLMAVDYVGIKNNPLYPKIIKQIENYDVSTLSNNNEKLSFYMNAYNILAIKMVLENWPVKSIKDVGSLFSSVWKKDVGKINHKIVTLSEIEHQILRKLGDPRIHMAIVCASVSCPDLRDEPYTAASLDQQLDEQSISFLNNSGKGLRIKSNVAEVSKIFDWFEEDFEVLGGVASFIRKYRTDIPAQMKIDADIDYNWNLNINR